MAVLQKHGGNHFAEIGKLGQKIMRSRNPNMASTWGGQGKGLRSLSMDGGLHMNETKVKILEYLSDGNWRTSSDIARWCALRLTNASELLRRYRGQGLVNRERNSRVPRGYLYRITAVGVERLRYFNSGVALTSSSMSDYIGLSGKEKRIFEEWVKQKLGGV